MTETERPEKPEECDFCDFETKDLEFCGGEFLRSACWLCWLCRSTQAGNMRIYPGNYDSNTKVLAQCIMVVGNMILAEMRRSR